MRRPRGVSVGFHKGCGGEVFMRVIPGVRTGFERFAPPDEPVYECEECGELDLDDDGVVEFYEEAVRDEDDEEEEEDEC